MLLLGAGFVLSRKVSAIDWLLTDISFTGNAPLAAYFTRV